MSGAFLSENRKDARERESDRLMVEYYELLAQRCYRWATGLLVAGMVVIALPQLGIAAWNWHIVGVLAFVMVVLAVQMMRFGRVGNGLVCLICALAVLPGWVYIADDVVKAGYDLYLIIAKQWADKFR